MGRESGGRGVSESGVSVEGRRVSGSGVSVEWEWSECGRRESVREGSVSVDGGRVGVSVKGGREVE